MTIACWTEPIHFHSGDRTMNEILAQLKKHIQEKYPAVQIAYDPHLEMLRVSGGELSMSFLVFDGLLSVNEGDEEFVLSRGMDNILAYLDHYYFNIAPSKEEEATEAGYDKLAGGWVGTRSNLYAAENDDARKASRWRSILIQKTAELLADWMNAGEAEEGLKYWDQFADSVDAIEAFSEFLQGAVETIRGE